MISLKYIFLVVFLIGGCRPEKQNPADQLPQKAMVSSAHPLATQVGLDILKAGGNAFDATVAIAAALNVVEPMMSGMGGYGTILIYDAKREKIRFLDSSGKIPAKMNSDLMRPPIPEYLDNRRSAKSISTPGNVNAWDAMSKQYGILPWEDIFKPAIRLAADGFPVSERLERMLEIAFESFPTHAQDIYGNEGSHLKTGELLVQKDLANSLKKLADNGRDIFYSGELAMIIDSSMKAEDSFLSIEDLINDKAEWWDPIMIDYKGYQVYTASPPANAFPALIRLGLMSQFSHLELEHNSALYLHLFAEATKHAYWSRLRYAGDPEITPPPLDKLLSVDYWNEITSQFDLEKAKDFKAPDYVAQTSENTTHFVVADQWGNIVSATQTLGNLFGSKIMPKGTGIWLNNSLAYSTYEPKGNPMDAIPGQRKLSGDCPTIIIKDGKPWAAIGTPGGHTIGQTVPQIIMNLIDFGMNINDAIQAPRISFVEPNDLVLEAGITDTIIANLNAKGHQSRVVKSIGNAHGLTLIYNEQGEFMGYEGAADNRGEGKAEGF